MRAFVIICGALMGILFCMLTIPLPSALAPIATLAVHAFAGGSLAVILFD